MMLKQSLLLLLLCVAAIPAFAVADPVPQMFVGAEIRITDHGKQRYLADVLIPRNQEVTDNTMTQIPSNITCASQINGNLPTNEDGIRIALTGQSSPDKLVILGVDYAIATSTRLGIVDFGVGCKRDDVRTTTRSGSGSKSMRESEALNIENDGVIISVTLKGSYATPPEGKIPGFFYRH